MNFITLLSTLSIGIVIATLITNMVRGIILTIAGLGIVFYLFGATPEQKISLDNYAKTISFSSALTNPFETSLYKNVEAYLYNMFSSTQTTIQPTP